MSIVISAEYCRVLTRGLQFALDRGWNEEILGTEEAIAVLSKICDVRIEEGRLYGTYLGRRVHLCRTDLKDDVCTFIQGITDLEEAEYQFRNNFRFGVRINENTLAPIDARSDG